MAEDKEVWIFDFCSKQKYEAIRWEPHAFHLSPLDRVGTILVMHYSHFFFFKNEMENGIKENKLEAKSIVKVIINALVCTTTKHKFDLIFFPFFIKQNYLKLVFIVKK